MTLKSPMHPGVMIKEIIHECGLTVTASAKELGVTRQALDNLINCRSHLSPTMALRIAKLFGGSAENWMRIQVAYDLALARDTVDVSGIRKIDQNAA